jgi:hypothetical protein
MSGTVVHDDVTHLVWEHLGWGPNGLGVEHLLIRSGAADGVIAWVDDEGRPYRLTYRIHWDSGWRFRGIVIDVTGTASGTLQLTRASDGPWMRDGTAASELDVCSEVDLWPTPFTNSLPIRRLDLEPGTSGTITVAHVIAPELSVTPRPQRYSNLGKGVYLFESLDDGFTAHLAIDDSGFVVDYPGLFKRRARLG